MLAPPFIGSHMFERKMQNQSRAYLLYISLYTRSHSFLKYGHFLKSCFVFFYNIVTEVQHCYLLACEVTGAFVIKKTGRNENHRLIEI